MLLEGFEIVERAAAEGWAIPGFVAYNLETAQGIVAAAERADQPVLIQAGASAFRYAGRRDLATLCLGLARASNTQIGVHLDHSRSLDEVRACLELGYTSVMFDGSHLPFAENVELTRQVVAHAHRLGVWVEAELVGTAGDEDVSTGATATAMTDPNVAARFVDETGIDALAVSVGNVHGFTEVEPEMDYPRLEQIRQSTNIPLVLHGASGLATETLQACLRRGVAKVNVNTELRRAYLDAFAAEIDDAVAKVDLVAPLTAAREAVAQAAGALIETLKAQVTP
jgi:tagatose 1,6-diphosphate aldolase GatY/KbaY